VEIEAAERRPRNAAGGSTMAGSRGGSPVAVNELEWALTRVARIMLRLGVPADALHPGEHVDRAGYWVLVRLDEAACALRLSDLATALQLDLSTVSRQVRDLVASGLVRREPDPDDGRACLLSLSTRGRDVLDAVRQARRTVLLDALAGWSSQERTALAAGVARLADDLQPNGQVEAR
jgi:DNA-binding MarR family transcriptional regulator